MGLLTEFREGRRARREVATMQHERLQHDASLEMMHERLAELELALEDESWVRLGVEGERDFSENGRRKLVQLARLMYLKNPLIRRAVNVQTYYVMGQGVEISGRSPAVNDVVQKFLGDPLNRKALTGHQGLTDRERDLQIEGEMFLALFTNPSTGHVKVRNMHPNEIESIISNPEDDHEHWFYLRLWNQVTYSDGAVTNLEPKKALYPAVGYRPVARPKQWQGLDVMWDNPVYYINVGNLGGMKRGLPDFYAGMAFARSYHSYLEDSASIWRSLSRWAWQYTAGKQQRVSSIKQRFGTTVGDDEGTSLETNPPPTAGSVFVKPSDGEFAPIPKTGASVSAEDGRALRTMVAAGVDIPDNILANDPQQGALATAKTLDRPTELAMSDRQQLWTTVFEDLCCFVVERAIVAPSGGLKGKVTRTEDDALVIVLGLDPVTREPMDAGVDVSFPPILDQDTKERVGAIVSAATLDGKALAGTIPAEEVSRQLMSALATQNIDEALDELFPPEVETELGEVIATFRAELKEFLARQPVSPNGSG